MKIKLDNLWQFSGVTIDVTNGLVEHEIPKGMYTFVCREEHGELRLYSPLLGFHFFSDWDDDAEIATYDQSNYTKRVDSLVEAQTALCIDLIGDGWGVDNQHLNLSPYLSDLEAYRGLQTLLKD